MSSSFTSLGPQLIKAQVDGVELVLDFDRSLDPGNTPSLDFWTVYEDSEIIGLQAIEQKSSVGRIILTLDSAVDSQSKITVGYRDLLGDQSSDVVQDTDGYDLVSFDDYSVDNQTERNSDELEVSEVAVDNNEVTILFNRELDDLLPSKSPFRFTANGKKVSIKDLELDSDGRELTLVLSRSIRFDEIAKLRYTDAEGDQRDNVLQDLEGNDLASFNVDVDNTSTQISALQLVSGEVEDSVITLEFNEKLSGTKVSKSRFKVKVNNKKVGIVSTFLDGDEGVVEIGLAKQVQPGDDILISYRDMNGDQSDRVVQDGFGNDLESFKNYSLDVTTSDNDGPALEDVYLEDGKLFLEFDELIAPGRIKGSRIKLRADGKLMKVKGTLIEDQDTVAIFELKKPVAPITQELLMSYKDPKRNQSSGVIEDLLGNDMSSIKDVAVEIVSFDV